MKVVYAEKREISRRAKAKPVGSCIKYHHYPLRWVNRGNGCGGKGSCKYMDFRGLAAVRPLQQRGNRGIISAEAENRVDRLFEISVKLLGRSW